MWGGGSVQATITQDFYSVVCQNIPKMKNAGLQKLLYVTWPDCCINKRVEVWRNSSATVREAGGHRPFVTLQYNYIDGEHDCRGRLRLLCSNSQPGEWLPREGSFCYPNFLEPLYLLEPFSSTAYKVSLLMRQFSDRLKWDQVIVYTKVIQHKGWRLNNSSFKENVFSISQAGTHMVMLISTILDFCTIFWNTLTKLFIQLSLNLSDIIFGLPSVKVRYSWKSTHIIR